MSNGFLQKLFAKKHEVYIAKGAFDDADLAPSGLDTLLTTKFIKFGETDASGSNITSTSKTQKIAFRSVPFGCEVAVNLVLVSVTPEMLEFISDMGADEYSFIFKPKDISDYFFAVSGITISPELNIPIYDGDNIAKITLKGTREADKLTDVVIYFDLPD